MFNFYDLCGNYIHSFHTSHICYTESPQIRTIKTSYSSFTFYIRLLYTIFSYLLHAIVLMFINHCFLDENRSTIFITPASATTIGKAIAKFTYEFILPPNRSITNCCTGKPHRYISYEISPRPPSLLLTCLQWNQMKAQTYGNRKIMPISSRPRYPNSTIPAKHTTNHLTDKSIQSLYM